MKRRFLSPWKILLVCCLLILLGTGSSTLLTTTQARSLLQPIPQKRPTSTSSVRSITPTPVPTLAPVLTAVGTPAPLSVTATYLVDEDSGRVLYDKNGEQPYLMASTTKIMTALIAIQTGNLNQPIQVHQDAVDHIIEDDGSGAALVVGDELSLKDMLYGLLLPSGDDAAYAIADALSGSQAAFVAHMNLFAQRLHLYQTHFNSSDGLTNDELTHYSSAHDLTILARIAMQEPLFARIVQTRSYTVHTASETYTWQNTNTLLNTYPGMTGIKTGHTNDSGYCLVFSATRNGHHLLGTVLGDPNQQLRDQDVTNLLDWGFALPMKSPNP
jgi:D-alanyl-D-alanine carboxypeptidase